MNMRVGMNSRLDTIQAAILIEKLAVFADEITLRNAAAHRYAAGAGGGGENPLHDSQAEPRSGRNTPLSTPTRTGCLPT